MTFDYAAIVAGLSEDNQRQTIVLQSCLKRIAELEVENNALRRYIATSKADCPYCGLPAVEMGRCASGFPGCDRADDMT